MYARGLEALRVSTSDDKKMIIKKIKLEADVGLINLEKIQLTYATLLNALGGENE